MGGGEAEFRVPLRIRGMKLRLVFSDCKHETEPRCAVGKRWRRASWMAQS